MDFNALKKEFEDRMEEELAKVNFPAEFIIPGVLGFIGPVLMHNSAMDLDCTFEAYVKLIEKNGETSPEWDLQAMTAALNGIEKTSPKNLDLNLDQYLKVIRNTRTMAAKWNELVKPIEKRVGDEVAAKRSQPGVNGQKVIQMGPRKTGYKGKRGK